MPGSRDESQNLEPWAAFRPLCAELQVATYKRFCDTYPIALLEAEEGSRLPRLRALGPLGFRSEVKGFKAWERSEDIG